ncbi:MAG: hypothetical protein A2X22_14410 [Bacteroidetes bacterium GWF2_49_14]|nr:MAG: hypothetical protein A2X22_14410 [Bacteroidetes bacterium GWF2_49_14]
MKAAGIFIILLGLGLTIFTSIKFFTREKVAEIGTVEITRNKPHNLQWSPLIGIGVIAVGGIILLVSYQKKK